MQKQVAATAMAIARSLSKATVVDEKQFSVGAAID